MKKKIENLTVITTVYNAELYLKDAIESVVNQTTLPETHLIVDDGSSDSSTELAKSYAKRYKHIKVIALEKNIGRSAVLNYAIESSNGEYVAILDSDDIALNDWIEVTMSFLEQNPDYGVVGGGGNIMTQSGEVTDYVVCNNPSGDVTNFIQNGQYVVLQPGSVFKKSLIIDVGGYSSVINTGEDNDLFINLSFRTKIYNLGRPLIFYRRLRSSLSRVTEEYQELMDKYFAQKSHYLKSSFSVDETNKLLEDWNVKFLSIKIYTTVEPWFYEYEMASFFIKKKKLLKTVKYLALFALSYIVSKFKKVKVMLYG